MALLTSELRRLRYELGYNVLSAGAEPYIGVHAVFETVIQTYLQAGAVTTCATAVTAATTPTLVTLTLASATDFTVHDAVVVDVDSRQERGVVQAISGSTISLLLTKAHSGTYFVTVEGGESIVRDLLRQCVDVASKIEAGASTAGIKKVDEVEFFENASRLRALNDQRDYLRDELASALGVVNLRLARNATDRGVVELY